VSVTALTMAANDAVQLQDGRSSNSVQKRTPEFLYQTA
jgi:hypothetical protein